MSIIPKHAPMMFGAKVVGEQVLCTFNDRMMEFLGSGRFSVAFRYLTGRISERNVIVFTFFEDFSKNILARAWLGTSHHLPQIKLLTQWEYRGRPCMVFKSEYIRPYVPGLFSKHLDEQVMLLEEIHDAAQETFSGDITSRINRCDKFNQWIITRCRVEGVDDDLISALEDLRIAALDWGNHYIFDNFHTKNLGVKNKKLIFLDPMFDMDKVQRAHDARKRLYRYSES